MDFENILPGILTQIKREKKQIANVSFEIERKISSLAKPLRAFQLKKYIIYEIRYREDLRILSRVMSRRALKRFCCETAALLA